MTDALAQVANPQELQEAPEKPPIKPPRVKVEPTQDGKASTVSPDCDGHTGEEWERALQEAFATGTDVLQQYHIRALLPAVFAKSHPHEGNSNAALAMLHAIQPRDTVETMLASQMLAIHHATMIAAGRLASADTREGRLAENGMFNKLARTFAAQMEALNRHRGKGQQKVTVEHVHVHEGGQAIVGNVSKGPGGGER